MSIKKIIFSAVAICLEAVGFFLRLLVKRKATKKIDFKVKENFAI
jgi:hypothetical protein